MLKAVLVKATVAMVVLRDMEGSRRNMAIVIVPGCQGPNCSKGIARFAPVVVGDRLLRFIDRDCPRRKCRVDGKDD